MTPHRSSTAAPGLIVSRRALLAASAAVPVLLGACGAPGAHVPPPSAVLDRPR